jgi:predicted porin
MKKMLFSATVCLTITGGAMAQTNVLVYGLLDVGVVRESGGPAGSVVKLDSGLQYGSRLGFLGTEDLGGGNSALFHMESGFDVSSGALQQGGLLFGRQLYAGIKNTSYGGLTFGRQYSTMFFSLGSIDPFGGGLAGTVTNLMSAGSKAVASGGSGAGRMNNAVKYKAPVLAGFTGELSYALGEVAGDNRANRQLDGSIGYSAGSLTLVLAHNRVENATGTDTAKVTFLGGKYNFGPMILSLGAAVNKGAFTASSNIVNPDSRDYLIGVTVPYGAGSFLASYIRKQDRSSDNNDANQMALGYTYALSKRTNLYTSWARMSNSRPNTAGNAGGFYTVGHALSAGTGDKAFNVGIRHTF